jgi:hypothetical protein
MIKHYDCYNEAKAAILKLSPVPVTVVQYSKVYKQNSLLPSRPDVKYKNNGWISFDVFLGIEKYSIYDDAKDAVQRLVPVPTSKIQYLSLYKQNSQLVATPETKYKHSGWSNWFEFLGIEPPTEKYNTYEEAVAALQLLDPVPKGWGEYLATYKQDPKLSNSPWSLYSKLGWTNFYDFFGKIRNYDDYEDVKAALRALNPVPSTRTEYKLTYKQDPKLPLNPDRKFKNSGWTKWADFLVKPSKVVPYTSYNDARNAVQQLVPIPTSREMYLAAYTQDPKLPLSPFGKYRNSGWKCWNEFLNLLSDDKKYASYEEAKAAVQKLDIVPTTKEMYLACYKQDPMLHSKPVEKYKDIGWKSWPQFLNVEPTIKHYTTYEEAKAAVQKLLPIPISKNEYKVVYKTNPKLLSMPDIKYKNIGWNSWESFLGQEPGINLYKTYEEACQAVQRLKPVPIKMTEYRASYKQDPRLPSNPHVLYKKTGWINSSRFLSQPYKGDTYEHYEDAKSALKKLIPLPQTAYEYRRERIQDPLLPISPQKKYADSGWIGWRSFIDNDSYTYKELVNVLKTVENKPKNPHEFTALRVNLDPRIPSHVFVIDGYYDWASLVGNEYECPLDALKLIRDLHPKITNIKEYKVLSESYLSLPENPMATYGFKSFKEFLTFDETKFFSLKELRSFFHKHKIVKREQYHLIALSEPKAPIDLKKIDGFTRFQYLKYKKSAFEVFDTVEYQVWVDLAEEYVNIGKGVENKKSIIKSFYLYHKRILKPNVEEQCSNHSNLIDPTDWFNNQVDSKRNESTLNTLRGFFDYILEKKCSHVCEDTGEVTYLEGYRIPLKLKNLPVEYISNRLFESNKQALPYKYIQKARQFITPIGVETIGGIFKAIKSKADYFDNHNDWFNVDESVIDKNDNNCIWRVNYDGGLQIWSPVKVIATLLQLYMPFRGSQIAWLDSGEADSYKLKFVDNKFVWSKNEIFDEKFRVKTKNWQGFLKPTTFGDINSTICAHVNTNKTGSNSYDGYNIPWVDERVIPFLIQLRDWQEKYNPILNPSRWDNVVISKKETRSELSKYGHNGSSCFLFRDPTFDGKSPIHQRQIGATLTGILHLIEDPELILTYHKKNTGLKSGQVATSLSGIRSYFTLHSMRVSLITAFIRDAKISPEIIQKLVGHSSLVMTIYYTKVEAETIRDELMNAEERIVKNQANRVEQMIRQRKLDEVNSEIFNAMGDINIGSINPILSSNSVMDYGICPNGRTQCSTGNIDVNSNNGLGTQVPSGYLGSENCLQCKYFLTGPSFLGGLQMLINETSLECKSVSIRMSDLQSEVKILEDEEYKAKKLGVAFNKAFQLSSSLNHYQQELSRFESFSRDMIMAVRYAMNSVTLLNKNISKNSPKGSFDLITAQDVTGVELQLNEVSEYMHLDIVCQSASYYQSSNPEKASLNRAQLIDLFARKNGFDAGMFALNKKQLVDVGNQITNMLTARFRSFSKVSELMDKNSLITLADLGVNQTDELNEDLKFLISGHDNRLAFKDKSNITLEC